MLSQAVTRWVGAMKTHQQSIMTAIEHNDRTIARCVEANAVRAMLDTLKQPEIRAQLVVLADPEVGCTEVVNTPSQNERVNIMARAMLHGFLPGENEFGIHSGNLYIKEKGYRKLFAQVGLVPDLKLAFPVYAELPLPDSNRMRGVWRVAGRASVTFRGVEYVEEHGEADALGIRGNDTDNVPSVEAKARRKYLQALWNKFAPVLTVRVLDDDDLPPPDDEQPTVTVVQASESFAAPVDDHWQPFLDGLNGAPPNVIHAAESLIRSPYSPQAGTNTLADLRKLPELSEKYVRAVEAITRELDRMAAAS